MMEVGNENLVDPNRHLCQSCLTRNNQKILANRWCHDCSSFQCDNCNQRNKCDLFDHKSVSLAELGALSQRPYEMTKAGQDLCSVETRQCPDSDISQNKPLFGRAAHRIGSVTVPGDRPYIRGIFVLPNGNLLVSEWYGKQLVHITESDDVLSTLNFSYNPIDICKISDENFAVSMWPNKIAIVRLLPNLSLIRIVQLTESHHAITFFDGALHITTDTDHTVRLCKMSDSGHLEYLKRLKTQSYGLTCSKSGDRIIGTLDEFNPEYAAVYRVSRDNTYDEVIKAGVVNGARGIDVDNEDNIYVCGLRSNNVLQISADGSTIRELLTSHEITRPYVIHVFSERLYISEENEGTIKIYKFE